MKAHSKFSTGLSESFEITPALRGRSNPYKSSLPKLRNGSSSILNISGSSNTTESSMLKMQESFSTTGKPPRVPLLKTNQVKQKEKEKIDSIFVEINDEKYYLSEYR